jgi:type VI secretion system protein ImpA
MMPSDFVDINITELLKPIDSSSPSGNYLRYSVEYDQIINAIREDNPNLVQGLWQYPLKRADWNKAKSICYAALKESSKDIQICNWLLSSLIHLYGFKGLSIGLELISQLTIQFWDSLHPLPVNGDYETRLAPYFWIEEKFFLQLRLLPITNPALTSNPLSLDRWERETKSTSKNFGTVFKELSEQAIAAGEDYFSAIKNEILSSINSIKQLKQFLLEKESRAPHMIQLLSTIENIQSIVDMALSEINSSKKNASEIEEEGPSENNAQGDALKVQKEKTGSEEITDITRAYAMIVKIADYLIKNEPDKLTGYILKNAQLFRKITLKEIYK